MGHLEDQASPGAVGAGAVVPKPKAEKKAPKRRKTQKKEGS